MNETGKSAKEALAYVKAIPPSQGETMMNVPFEKRDLVRFGLIGADGKRERLPYSRNPERTDSEPRGAHSTRGAWQAFA